MENIVARIQTSTQEVLRGEGRGTHARWSAAEGVSLLAFSLPSFKSRKNKEKKLKRQEESHPEVTGPCVAHTRSTSEHLRSSRNAAFLFLFLVQLLTSPFF